MMRIWRSLTDTATKSTRLTMACGTGRNRGNPVAGATVPKSNKEVHPMKTTFYLNGKKTSRKALTEMLGADRLKRYIEEAKEAFFEDPLTQNSFWLGGKDMLTIEFK